MTYSKKQNTGSFSELVTGSHPYKKDNSDDGEVVEDNEEGH